MNNRTLLIIFGVCLVLFVGSKLLRGNKSSSFDPEIVKIDSAKVDRMQFSSPGPEGGTFELKKTADGWEAVQGDMTVKAGEQNIQSILSQLAHLKVQRVVTKDASKYPEYEITDEQASRVVVYEGKKEVANLLVGGFRFDQAARSASSFLKANGKPEVYIMDGFLSMSLKARFDQFRDKKLVKANADDLTSVAWSNNANQKQVITKEEGIWHYAGMEAVDSTTFANYLSSLVNAQGNEFSELKTTQGLSMIEKITLTGNNMIAATEITAYATPDTLKPFLIASTDNPEAIFKSDSSGLYKRIFLDLRPFWPNGQ